MKQKQGKLRKKRKRVIYTVLAVVVGNALVTAAPLVDIDIAKKLFLTFANVLMFIVVWDAYFDEQLASKNMFSILQDLFAVTCISVVTTFSLSQGVPRVINNFVTLFGSLGWGIAGAISGFVTAILGTIWGFYCDDIYRNSAS